MLVSLTNSKINQLTSGQLCVFAMAFFVFLATTTWTWIIAADFLFCSADSLGFAASSTTGRSCRSLTSRLLGLLIFIGSRTA
jgi:hypothetical protein